MRTHKKSIGYKEASLLETNWAGIAHREGVDELKRAKLIIRKNPELAKELMWDSRIAFKFEGLRKKRVKRLMKKSRSEVS